ncbi:MAG: DUF4258 domain-containing protein [Anaerolineae bacterium]|nr:DUF4258 domain-containing protein [Anaerolineae bacterium]
MLNLNLSDHAQQRSAQRNLSNEDIAFVIRHGDRVHRTGVIFCQLRSRNIPDKTPGNHRWRQLIGTTVVLCKCGGCVVTVYREERAFQRDCRKAKYALKGNYCDHTYCSSG